MQALQVDSNNIPTPDSSLKSSHETSLTTELYFFIEDWFAVNNTDFFDSLSFILNEQNHSTDNSIKPLIIQDSRKNKTRLINGFNEL